MIDSPVPEVLRPYLDTYLRHWRPILLKQNVGSRALWINSRGNPLGYAAFWHLFRRMGIQLIGKPISVHSTRFAYATATLSVDARDIEVASAGLAHTGISSVNRYYDRSSKDGISNAWLKVLNQRRKFG